MSSIIFKISRFLNLRFNSSLSEFISLRINVLINAHNQKYQLRLQRIKIKKRIANTINKGESNLHEIKTERKKNNIKKTLKWYIIDYLLIINQLYIEFSNFNMFYLNVLLSLLLSFFKISLFFKFLSSLSSIFSLFFSIFCFFFNFVLIKIFKVLTSYCRCFKSKLIE